MKVVGVRDNICVESQKTTCGSKMLENFVSPYNASIIDKLNKANMEIKKVSIKEFGIEDDEYICEEIKQGHADGIIATDFDGQIARSCKNKTVGIKPTFGVVSRYGVVTIAPSLEQVGIIAKDVQSVSDLLNIIKGYDNKDSGSASKEDYNNKENLNINVGYIEEGIINNFQGKKTKIQIKNLKYAKHVNYIISSAEASSNLARFDGIRYGYRAEDTKTWKEVYTKTRKEGFGYEVKKKMLAGTFFLDVDNIQEYYIRAQKVRTIIKQELEEIFKKVDIIAVPNQKEYTCLANLTGRPALTINGTTFIGKHFDEDNLILLAKTYGGDR